MALQDMVERMLGLSENRREWHVADPDQLQTELEKRFGRVTRSQGHNGLELVCDCPVCGKHKLSVNAVSGVYKCWVGCMSGHVRKLLKTHVAMTTAPVHSEKKNYGYIDPGTCVSLATVDENNPAAVYLQARGFNARYLGRAFGLEYCGSGRKFAKGLFSTSNTVMIPVVMNGTVLGWQARLLYDPEKLTDAQCALIGLPWDDEKKKYRRPPKYMTMPGMDKRNILWNFDNARKSELVVVTEGVFDAVKVGLCGVATFGKSVSDQQVALLQQYWKCVVLLLDPDAARDAERLRRKFGPLVRTVLVTLKGYKDAGEAPQTEIWSQIIDTLEADGGSLSEYSVVV